MSNGIRLENDAQQKALQRSQETKDERELRLLVNASRAVDVRANETKDEHLERLAQQNKRQKALRAMETPDMVKARQESDASNKSIKRSLKAAAFEDSLNPNLDWNSKLDSDMIRHQKSRALETEEESNKRKERDVMYQRNKRDNLSEQQRKIINQKKIEYGGWKRNDLKERNSEKWSEIHRQNNLLPLQKHGSYFKFLVQGDARTSFYGQKLPTATNASEWIWLENKITGDNIMGSEFHLLSKKFAVSFKQVGLEKGDVVHLITGNCNETIGILGGIWILGGVCSLSSMTTDVKTIETQVSLQFVLTFTLHTAEIFSTI